MRVKLRFSVYKGSVDLHLWQPQGRMVGICRPMQIVFDSIERHVASPETPSLEMPIDELIEFHDDLTKELRLAGYLRPEPSIELLAEKDRTIKMLDMQLKQLIDAVASREAMAMRPIILQVESPKPKEEYDLR